MQRQRGEHYKATNKYSEWPGVTSSKLSKQDVGVCKNGSAQISGGMVNENDALCMATL